MGRVRVFYGHEGVVPPTGSRPRSAAPAAPAADEAVADSLTGEVVEPVGEAIPEGVDPGPPAVVEYMDGTPVETDTDGYPLLPEVAPAEEVAPADEVAPAEEVSDLPDDSWTGPELDSFAVEYGIDLTGAKKTKAEKLARILEALEVE